MDEPRINQTQQQVAEIASTLSQLTSLRICHQLRFGDERYFAFAATLAPAPTPDEWISRYDTPAKLAYVSERGPALPVWWAQFSFVYPVWHPYFNLWSPRPSDPQYLDANWTEDSPSAEWATTLAIVERVIASYGFAPMNQAAFHPTVESVRHEVFSDDDDDDSSPRLETCSIGQCLFSEC